MTEEYINRNYDNIKMYENSIEDRKDKEDIDIKELIKENIYNLEMCKKYANDYILIDKDYKVDILL